MFKNKLSEKSEKIQFFYSFNFASITQNMAFLYNVYNILYGLIKTFCFDLINNMFQTKVSSRIFKSSNSKFFKSVILFFNVIFVGFNF